MTPELDETERLVLAAWQGLKPLGERRAPPGEDEAFWRAHRALCHMVDPMSLLERLAAATDKAEGRAEAVKATPEQEAFDEALAAYSREWNSGPLNAARERRLLALERAIEAARVPGVVERPC